MKLQLILFIFLSSLLIAANGCRKDIIDELENKPMVVLPPNGYVLVWSDEFSDKELDQNKWNYRASGVRRQGFNDKETVSLDTINGWLNINTFLRGDTIFTGMIGTQGLFETKYGYFECRAKFEDIVPSYWPAFWLQSRNYGRTLDPYKDGMEIDIMEFYGGNSFTVLQAVHWNGYGQHHRSSTNSVVSSKRFDDGDFHIFSLEWKKDTLDFFVDGHLVWTVTEPVSEHEQFMILSTEVDNATVFAREMAMRGKNSVNFVVDYVRVYKRIE